MGSRAGQDRVNPMGELRGDGQVPDQLQSKQPIYRGVLDEEGRTRRRSGQSSPAQVVGVIGRAESGG